MFLEANYILPMSKDMPGSDELFDKVIIHRRMHTYGCCLSWYLILRFLVKVIFVELDRGEAQRHLDEMKRALGSASNSNILTNQSSSFHETSVHSSTRPSLEYRGSLLGNVAYLFAV